MPDSVTEMEKFLTKQYATAKKDVEKKLKAYLKQFKELDKQKKKDVKSGKITEDEYYKWKVNKILYGTHWQKLLENIAADMTRTNELAVKYINGQVPDIFINAFNSLERDIPIGPVEGYSFELINADTVNQLVKSKEIILPPPKDINKYKDKLWNIKNVNAAVLQGIMQGESMDAIALRVAAATAEKNEAAAIRNARTMVTAAENSGRAAGIKQAEKDGVILDKIWRATSDSRTRDSHAKLDGERRPSEKAFSNGLMFPGDWNTNNPAEVYNCRCTLITKFVGFDNKRYKTSERYQENVKKAKKEDEKKFIFPYAIAGKEELEKIINSMSPEEREQWIRNFEYTDIRIIAPETYDDVEYRIAGSNIIYLFEHSSAETALHETSHAIDDVCCSFRCITSGKEKRFGKWKDLKSKEYEYKGASYAITKVLELNNEGEENYLTKDLRSLYKWAGISYGENNLPSISWDEAQDKIVAKIKEFGAKHGKTAQYILSDLIDGTTHGEYNLLRIPNCAGHEKNYWIDNPNNEIHELWAEACSLKALGMDEAWKEIENIIPEKCKAFNNVYGVIYNGEEFTRTIRREDDRRIQEEVWRLGARVF